MRSVFSFLLAWAAPLPIRPSFIIAIGISLTMTIIMNVKSNITGLGQMSFSYDVACFAACMTAWVIGRVLFKNELIIYTSLLYVEAGAQPRVIEAPIRLVAFAASLACVWSICFAIGKKIVLVTERNNHRKRD